MIGISIVVALFGLIVGSFLNVVILRLHDGKSLAKGRSCCPKCKRQLKPLELIPVISWLALRGRCHGCKKPISSQYPIVEALTAAVFLTLYLVNDPTGLWGIVVTVLWGMIAAGLIVLAVYDIRWYELPDKILLPLVIPATVIIAIQAATNHSWEMAYKPLLAALLFGGFFYGLAAISDGKWMGGGDIKLAALMGLLLGLQKTALAMFIAFNIAAIVGLVLLLLKRKGRADQIPFGPFLILGIAVSYVAGNAIIDWYLGISGLNLL